MTKTDYCRCVALLRRLAWLFASAEVLLPSVYLPRKLTLAQKIGLVRGRVQESVRLAKKSKEPSKVYAYYWYKYQDERDAFVEKVSATLCPSVTIYNL